MLTDFAGNVDSRKNITIYVFTLESGAVSWVSRLQKAIALSTMEAEYVTATEACKELIWLKNFLKEFEKEQEAPSLHSDSQSAIDLVNNLIYHDRTKHISLHPQVVEGWCILTAEETHELESSKYVNQDDHGGEAEKLFSFCES